MRFHVLVLITGLLMLLPASMAAAAPMSQQATLADWQARIPVLMVIIVFVLAVDLAFIVPVMRKLRRS